MREKYESLSLAVLRDLAKARGMKGISALKKGELIEVMLAEDTKGQAAADSQVPVMQTEKAESPETGLRAEKAGAQAEDVHSERTDAQGQELPAERAERSEEVQRQPERSECQGDRPMRTERFGNRPERMDRGNRPERYERAERTNRIERPERNEQMERAERPNRMDRTDRGNRMNRPERTERMENPERMERADRGNRMERPERTERMENPERMERADRGSRMERPERAERMESTERSEQMERAERPNRMENTASPARTEEMPPELGQLDSGMMATGILEVMADGFGFIRSDNYMPGENDVYVSPSQIRRFNLKTGDIISGNTRIKTQTEKFSALLYLKTINGKSPAEAARRYNFEDMTPIFPNERLRMERGSRAVAMRIVDLFSPIGKGQRGMIVSPPKAGKTTLLKEVAHSILENDPNMKLLILLIDERPEEVTDIKEAICGENVEVIYSTFDELPEHHKRVSEMVIERAKRLVEQKENVTILLDSITRLARAYNLTVPPSGRTLSGGLDPAALHMPKRFFGAARNMREGGSLTILATALVDTGSKMDDVVYEEFKGTGNMELVLDRKLSEKRVFPAIDIPKSGTRREDLLLDKDEQEAVYIMRRALNGMKSDEAVENILNTFVHTRDNRELVQKVKRQRFV